MRDQSRYSVLIFTVNLHWNYAESRAIPVKAEVKKEKNTGFLLGGYGFPQ